jgi:regulator of sirC expression with transglutaminase-like and TPR domain
MSAFLDRSLQEFVEAVSRPDGEIDIARAALVASKFERADLEIESILESLNALAARVVIRAGGSSDPIEQVEALVGVVLRDFGLKGNRRRYDDPRNSLLHCVLERKLGIPVSIGIVCLGVADRAGAPLAGTALPMHFVVRVLGVRPARFIDVFNGGRMLDAESCLQAVERMSNGALRLDDRALQPVSNVAVLARMLTNLKLVYITTRNFDRAAATLDRLLVLNPLEPSLMRERGLVRYRLGQSDLARGDLQHYLDRNLDADDAPKIRELLRRLS